jgi:peptidyl-dipeptidase Dcp
MVRPMKRLSSIRALPFALMLALVASAGVLAQTPPQMPPGAAAASPTPPPNPLLTGWKTPFGVPPFDQIKTGDFAPALTEAMARDNAEIAAIADNPEPPTFANTIEALADSGEPLERVEAVFSNLRSADTNDELQAVAREVVPRLAAHADDVLLNEKLFKRLRLVWGNPSKLHLTVEQKRLLEETYSDFVRAGALLRPADKERMREINKELSTLSLRFSDNVLQETNAYRLVIEKHDDLAGLPDGVVAAAAQAAKAAGLEGKWLFTLQAPSIWPFLEYDSNPELRRQILTAYLTRCDHGGEHDNNDVIAKIAALRVEKANLLGYPTWADYVLEKRMAKTPAGVRKLLDQVWPAALARAKAEAADLQEVMNTEVGGEQLQPWDWRYYAEKERQAEFHLDDAELRPYFALERVRDGAFMVANRLYGLTFTELASVPVYNPDVKAFEVKDSNGAHLGVLYLDYYPRPGKRGGAWTSAYRKEWIDHGHRVAPVVVNVASFPRPTGDVPALLSLEEVRTLFHEFGHALHQLFSECRYRTLSGTSVPRDFVELPSQIMEYWATDPAVLKLYARHWKTGAPIPDELIRKIEKARTFGQGFATTEYLAAALLDMDWHTLRTTNPMDTAAFERSSLDRMGLIPEIPPRYHSVYFSHIVGGYAAGYYSYIWSEVLAADAFQAFKEKGLFDHGTAAAFRDDILAKGNSEDPAALYLRFRGRMPSVKPLLERRGLE